MEKSLAYAFDYMLDGTVCSVVYVYQDGSVVVDDKTEYIVERPFGSWGSEATIEDVEKLFESRCFPRTRGNCKQILKSGGIDFYNPIEIVRKTEGRMTDDSFWIRFHD